MADGTTIEWAQHPVTGRGASWNPLLAQTADGRLGYHCEHVTEACRNCYAEAFNKRNLPARGTGLAFKPGHRNSLKHIVHEPTLKEPLKWSTPRGIFVCSMTDIFGPWNYRDMVDQVVSIMYRAPQHVYFVLTKRPDLAAEYARGAHTTSLPEQRVQRLIASAVGLASLKKPVRWPPPNLWLGTSVHDQDSAAKMIWSLLDAQVALHWISAEPLLGPIDLTRLRNPTWPEVYLNALTGQVWHEGQSPNHPPDFKRALRWVVVGGESGAKARPVNPEWVCSLRDQCAVSGVPFFFKQWGEWVPKREVLQPGFERRRKQQMDEHLMVRVGSANDPRTLEGHAYTSMPEVA